MASYIHGTGAEKLAPSEREERLQRKRRQDVGRSVKRQHRIRRNQERAMYMDLPYVIMLTLASICTLYLSMRSRPRNWVWFTHKRTSFFYMTRRKVST